MSETTFDFIDGKGHVPAHRHTNPDGSTGGWVADSAQVYGDAWVSGDAQVYGNARVSGNARVFGDAWVYGNARVSGNARVFGDARVYGNARVFGNAQVSGDAWVYGNAQVYGDAWVSGDPDIMFGRSGAYDWTAMRVADGSVWLRYGCEFHAVAEWPSVAASLAVQHEKQNAARYAALTLALVEFVAKAMPRKEIEG